MEGADPVEIPQYFTCPISLQIMKDPVTAITGITYDRDSIERWLFSGDAMVTCPVTNQPLPRDSDLTPNHTLRRLIQAWCTLHRLDRIPTPPSPLTLLDARSFLQTPTTQTLSLLSSLAGGSHSNRRCLLLAGAPASLASLITKHSNQLADEIVSPAISLLHSLRPSPDQLRQAVDDNPVFLNSLPLLLSRYDDVRSTTILVLKSAVDVAGSKLLERLPPEFFEAVAAVIRDRMSPQSTRAALHVLLSASPHGRNRIKMVEAGVVAEIIELELSVAVDRRTTELGLGVLDHLCGCADGRAQLVGHAAGIALVSKRILRVSPAADERAVGVLSSVCRYSATREVLQEMLRVGAVSKLCFVLQADCSSEVREKARWVLRLHSGAWKDSPCIKVYMLSRYPQHIQL